MGHSLISSGHKFGGMEAGAVQKRGSCPQTGPEIRPSGPFRYGPHLWKVDKTFEHLSAVVWRQPEWSLRMLKWKENAFTETKFVHLVSVITMYGFTGKLRIFKANSPTSRVKSLVLSSGLDGLGYPFVGPHAWWKLGTKMYQICCPGSQPETWGLKALEYKTWKFGIMSSFSINLQATFSLFLPGKMRLVRKWAFQWEQNHLKGIARPPPVQIRTSTMTKWPPRSVPWWSNK